MTEVIALAPGANAPLGPGTVDVDIEVQQLGGAAVLVEAGDGAVRLLSPTDPFATVTVLPGEQRVRVQVSLERVAPEAVRLRLLVWSPGLSLPLARTVAVVAQVGGPQVQTELPGPARELRAAELVEFYRRGDGWKVRAVASGWVGHVAAMADAVGLPASAFAVAAPEPSSPPTAPVSPPPPEDHEGPSPAVGPPALRELLDEVVGPGARYGDDTFVDFALHGMLLRLSYERSGDLARIIAVSPGGEGELTDTVALAALRATGEAPLAVVSFAEDETTAFVSAPAVAHVDAVDSALLKALLAEVWVTAARFNARMRTARRWQRPPQLTDQIPRELRLGIAEELQDESAWADVHSRLLAAGGMPLVDEPAAVLMPSDSGQLVVGPSLLSGTARAWAILVERTVRASVRPEPGLWRAIAARNDEQSFVRFGVQDEGLPGDPPAIHCNYAALQLPRTAVTADLQRGLEFVDHAAEAIEDTLRHLAADSADYRNNLPWPTTRRWSGPGSEIKEQLLVREIEGLPADALPPDGLAARAQAQAAALQRAGLGYVAHVALLRAEAGGDAGGAWREVSRELVQLAPIAHAPDDGPCATASLHVRLGRLDAPRPMRPPPPPAPAARSIRRRLFG
ncbi:MAG: hypothetical protein JHD16_01395 [Solirubrobacteraceae bacterium]|nr:hypothetical protein [Solirubrobacteraceae bacterium]